MIVEFIVGVYVPCWFQIKVRSCWVDGSRHILYQLKLLKYQNKNVIRIVTPTIKRSAWYAFSENILQTLLCSDDPNERKFGVQKIIELRKGADLGDLSVRSRPTPSINCDATSLIELISWSSNVYEPPLTCKMSITQITEIIDKPMVVPNWPCHGQSIERVVKQVTEASNAVYSAEKREGYIRCQEASREIMTKNNSKQDLIKLTD